MVFDLDMIRRVYSGMAEKVEKARRLAGKPLTLTEKILYSHLKTNLFFPSGESSMTLTLLNAITDPIEAIAAIVNAKANRMLTNAIMLVKLSLTI